MADPNSADMSSGVKRNALSVLMASAKKPKPGPIETLHKSTQGSYSFRDALAPLIQNPDNFVKSGEVMKYTEDYVLIHDKYPKASVHLLILPRESTRTRLHPFQALCPHVSKITGTKDFYDRMSEIVRECEDVAIRELKDLYKKTFTAEDLKVGVHSAPSMSNLHIHVISVDNYSEKLKNKKHYNTFNTPFFVSFDELGTMTREDARIKGGPMYCAQIASNNDLICWRCEKNFQNQFKKLKDHLEEEFILWKREKAGI
ncbi:HIT-like domain-containing protein [Lipomyces kononenkoae]|uniref:HIT-like domain-containing protein n=1 Tax=Lipomyces kononenkoae TaxID=34357 RepID=A0ACC3T019_LIPKO